MSAITFSFAILLVRLCAGSSDRSAAHLAARSYCDNPSILAPASSHAPKCLTFPRPHSFVHSFAVACSDPWPTFCRSVVAFFCGATFPCLQRTQSVHNRHTHLTHTDIQHIYLLSHYSCFAFHWRAAIWRRIPIARPSCQTPTIIILLRPLPSSDRDWAGAQSPPTLLSHAQTRRVRGIYRISLARHIRRSPTTMFPVIITNLVRILLVTGITTFATHRWGKM